MTKNRVLAVGVIAVLALLAGCAGETVVNSYLLNDANIGGDASRSLKPVKSILVWPLENIAAGTKSKGVETSLSGILADTLSLHSGFERVVILEEDQAKELMTRAGEELGLKKKPKAPGDGALIATKLGQLTGTEVILVGRLEVYDEDKVDKATLTVVAGSFNLLDAREKAYAALDSFTPVKRVWRTNVKRSSKEGPFNNREGLDDAARAMLGEVVSQITSDMGQGVNVSGKAQAAKLKELNAAADKALAAGEYDKAIASLNDVVKIQPESKKAKARVAEAERRKKAAQDKEKADALRKQVEEIKAKADTAEKAGEFEAAAAEWKKVLDLDKGNKEAAKKVEALEKAAADAKKAKREAADKAAAEKAAADKVAAEKAAAAKAAADKVAAEKAAADKAAADKAAADKAAADKAAAEKAKPAEAPKAAEPAKVEKKAEEAKPAEAPKAGEPAKVEKKAEEAKPAEAAKAVEPAKVEKKAEEAKPAEAPKAVEPAKVEKKAEEAKPAEPPKAVEPAKVEKKAEEAKPAAAKTDTGGGELEAARGQAMAAFNKEDYAASRDLWKKILEKVPEDKQAKEMLETTEMLLNALK